MMVALVSCGGEGGESGPVLDPPSGDGLLLAGVWDFGFDSGNTGTFGTDDEMTLSADGTFTDRFSSGTATGFWTSGDGVNFTMIYRYQNENPPRGTAMTGTVNAARTAISETIDSSPISPGYGSWSAAR